MHFAKNNYGKAIADYTEAIRLDPNMAIAYRNRGVSHARKGDLDKTIADYLNEVIAKTGEKITIKRFARFQIGAE